MKIRAILFDLDGTLIDQFEAIHRAFSKTLITMGFPSPSFEKVKRAVGGASDTTMVKLIGPERATEAVSILRPIFEQVESNESQQHLYGYPQIRSKGSIFAELSESINLEKLSKQVSEFLHTATLQINNLHTGELRDSFLALSKNTNLFLDDFSKKFLPLGNNLGSTSNQIRKSFENLDLVNQRIHDALAPDSDLRFGAVNAMHDLSEMSKSLKSLSDLLERNPQALIRGKINTED